MTAKPNRFAVWETQVPERIKNERIWRFIGYRKALNLYDLVWDDTRSWQKDPRGWPVVGQLISSVSSISANLEEGNGQETGKQKLYFYQVSLASAREAKGWFFRSRHLLGPDIAEERLELVDEVIALLVSEIRFQKRKLADRKYSDN